MAVAIRRKTKIIIDDETYFWSVSPHIPGDGYPTLVIVSPDKKLCFSYPLDQWSHTRFMASLLKSELAPPVPELASDLEPDSRNPAFRITPGFVKKLVRWCLETQCPTTPEWC